MVMSKLICEINGVRGRRIAVYDNKCVITTDATLGSFLTSNALDGEKTIFYADVVGVQFKRCSATLGYLQLETPSMQMNNQTNNMFSENTFTFDESGDVTNFQMAKVRDYIVARIEGYKYGTLAEEPVEAPAELLKMKQVTPATSAAPVIVPGRQWTCKCGTKNPLGIYKCSNCGRNKA